MGFAKGFGIGLAVFVALNFVFSLIVAAIGNSIGLFFSSLAQWENIFSILFYPIASTPLINIFGIIGGAAPLSIAGLLQPIFYFISPAVAAILAGRFAGGKRFAFLAWFLISILCAALLLIPLFLNPTSITLPLSSFISTYMSMFGVTLGSPEYIGFIILMTLSPGAINAAFYAPFGMAVSEAEFY